MSHVPKAALDAYKIDTDIYRNDLSVKHQLQ